MGFTEVAQAPLVQGQLGRATVTILGAQGLRLTGLTSFHLDEGPDFAWLNIYRTLAAGRQLEITRERKAEVYADGNSVIVKWEPTSACETHLSVRYTVVETDMAIDVTFAATAERNFNKFELFIASYYWKRLSSPHSVGGSMQSTGSSVGKSF